MAGPYDVAVLHDYFVDRLVTAKSLDGLLRHVSSKSSEGGGGLHGIRQSEIRGGNAVNLAHALARLGLRTLLITHSEGAHLGLLESTFEGLDVDLRVKHAPAGLTVAFEEKVNVMLGDARGAGDFGPQLLEARDWDALKRSRVVCSVNWAANRKGTALLLELRKRLGRKATIFLDPADFRDRTKEFADLLGRVTKARLVDWVSMNREEAAAAAQILGLEAVGHRRRCAALSRALGVRFDLHGEESVFTSVDGRTAGAKVGKVEPRRLTGAGDVWDAGTIYGALGGMKDTERLKFANAAAKLYLESKVPVPPSLDQVLRKT